MNTLCHILDFINNNNIIIVVNSNINNDIIYSPATVGNRFGEGILLHSATGRFKTPSPSRMILRVARLRLRDKYRNLMNLVDC